MAAALPLQTPPSSPIPLPLSSLPPPPLIFSDDSVPSPPTPVHQNKASHSEDESKGIQDLPEVIPPVAQPLVLSDFRRVDHHHLVGSGLANLGNTCFLNAILQCFTHTAPLVHGIRSCDHDFPCERVREEFCVLCILRQHMETSLDSSRSVVSPWQLVDNLDHISSFFRRYQQEDAHEFLQCLLDKLDSWFLDSGSPNDVNLVKHIFGGRLISKLRCCSCGHCSDSYEAIVDLSLNIKDADTLQIALDSFTSVEKIEEPDTKFVCEGCKQEVAIEKQFMLDQAPSIATFHLKRFRNDGFNVEKIDTHVGFPLELDMKNYMANDQYNGETKYELYAIVVHEGFSPNSGHYFCFIRPSQDTWYAMDDSEVTRVSEDQVLAQDAYILFYAKSGTPWISSLMAVPTTEQEKTSISPTSVLDNLDEHSPHSKQSDNSMNKKHPLDDQNPWHSAKLYRLPTEEHAAAPVASCSPMSGVTEMSDRKNGEEEEEEEAMEPLKSKRCKRSAMRSYPPPPRWRTLEEESADDLREESYHPKIEQKEPHAKEHALWKKPTGDPLEDSKRKEALRLMKGMPSTRQKSILAAMAATSHGRNSSGKKSRRKMVAGLKCSPGQVTPEKACPSPSPLQT